MIQSRKGLGSHCFISGQTQLSRRHGRTAFGGCSVNDRLGKEEWKKRCGNIRNLFPSSMFNRLYRAKSCLPRFASGDFAEELCMKLVETCSHYYLAKDQKGSR